ncbi:MAG TPA: glutamate--tRNA ligase family protein [Puia sp.]|nr:glutamate--tRNA ligase family protein [Puia sp.]
MSIDRGVTRTRIAPTPSGFLHVGNVLSFSLTVALARREGASVLLRIDDLDRERVQPEYLEDIFETLRFLKIPWDEGPANALAFERAYSQLHRMELYEKALLALRASGSVFACTCSRAQLRDGYSCGCRDKGLSLDTVGASWRLSTSPSSVVAVKTWDRGIVEAALPVEVQDFVVRKKGGFPAYQLTSLVDDIYYGVDLVVRGEDLWPSTLAQQYLASLLPGAEGFRSATFYHHGLLEDAGGGKLSKSAGATSIRYMRGQGMSAADIYTSIARLLGKEVAIQGWEELAGLVLE